MLFASLLFSALTAVQAEAVPPKVGEVFPDLEFPVLGQEDIGSLSDFRGSKVLLIQFASW